jgi:hypothetical protein
MHQKTVEGLRCGADRPALVAVVAIVLNVVVPDRRNYRWDQKISVICLAAFRYCRDDMYPPVFSTI